MRNDQSTFIKELGYMIDTFDELQDMRWSDMEYLAEYRKLVMQKNDGLPVNQARLEQLESRFKNKIVTSARWNKFQNALLGMQTFIKEEVEGFVRAMQLEVDTTVRESIITLNRIRDSTIETINEKKEETLREISRFAYRGEYNNSKQYLKWNTVKFRGKSFLCIKDTIANEPTDTRYWVQIADDGDKVNWRGTWSQVIAYKHLDMVVYDNALYICVLDNFNKLPTVDTNHWNLIITNRNDVKNQYYADYKDGGFILEHNLGEYPVVQAMARVTYGHGGYGLFDLNNKYHLNNIVEYIDKNRIRISFVEKFIGVPSLQQLSARKFALTYSGEDESIELILK